MGALKPGLSPGESLPPRPSRKREREERADLEREIEEYAEATGIYYGSTRDWRLLQWVHLPAWKRWLWWVLR